MGDTAAQRLQDLMAADPSIVLDVASAASRTAIEGTDGLVIADLTLDSRAVTPGALFAAMPGTQVDGARFIPSALERGAVAVLCSDTADLAENFPFATVPMLRAADPRRALALMAARFFGRQPATAVAVTGTSGKSSVAEFTRQIFAACGRSAASVGTIGVVRPDGSVYGGLTTPDPVTLHRSLAELASEGVTHLAFEASSHGIDQRRLDGVHLKAAAFTNLGRDHLDYHPTIGDYFLAKQRLFDTLLPAGAMAVLNIDGDYGARLQAVAAARGIACLTVGCGDADLRITHVRRDGFGQDVTVAYKGQDYRGRLDLIGGYQAENAALAAGLAIAAGEDPRACIEAFAGLRGVAGRLEPVGAVAGATVLVDYAHKPEALEAVLGALKPFATGRLICVFGCGGDRDAGKRPIMGEIASRLADVVIVTDDNPRSEDPASVRRAILNAAPGALEIGDRRRAIEHAIADAGPGDVVLIAGKGHETGQIVGDKVLPFSDQETARGCIAQRAGGGDGP